MRRLRARRLSLPLALTLIFSLLFVTPALGTDRTWTSLYDSGGHPWNFVGTWGGGNYFNGHYQVIKVPLVGWYFTSFEISGVVEGGGNCIQCEGWSFSATVQFYTSANVKVGGDYRPPIASCYAHSGNPSWIYLYKCASSYTIPASATKIKYTLRMFSSTCCGVDYWDTVYKTVPIV